MMTSRSLFLMGRLRYRLAMVMARQTVDAIRRQIPSTALSPGVGKTRGSQCGAIMFHTDGRRIREDTGAQLRQLVAQISVDRDHGGARGGESGPTPGQRRSGENRRGR